MSAGRGANGRFAKGMQNNPGGLSKRQSSVLKMLDGLTPRAVEVIGELLESPDEGIRLKAAAEIIKRVAPKTAPGSQTNVNLAIGVQGGGMQQTLALAAMRQLHRAGRISDGELAAVQPPTIGALPLPAPAAAEVIDVDCTPVDDCEVTDVA
ncbi:MAG: hypothetical protein U1E60_14640 [Reyranellaceae bacterium]